MPSLQYKAIESPETASIRNCIVARTLDNHVEAHGKHPMAKCHCWHVQDCDDAHPAKRRLFLLAPWRGRAV